MRRQPVTLSSREQATAIRLLGELQTYLESLIDGHTIGGVATNGSARSVADARRDWGLAERLVKRFSA